MDHPFPRYSPAERRLDRWLNYGGLLAGAVGCAVLAAVVAGQGDAGLLLSTAGYAAGLMAMLACSLLYNEAAPSPRKERLRRLDHAAIFLLIAGTATPFLFVLGDGAASLLLWLAAGAGVLLKLAAPRRFERLSILAYLALGWAAWLAIAAADRDLPSGAVGLLALGGGCYTAGVLFHVTHRLPYHNALWHGLVLAGAGSHFAAVLMVLRAGGLDAA